MARRKKSRIYWRNGRAWADFRDYRDEGGGREPLVVPGEQFGTSDLDSATQLVATRLDELAVARRNGCRAARSVDLPTLETFSGEHLVRRAQSGNYSRSWLEAQEVFLRRACKFFGADRPLVSITVADVERFREHLKAFPNRRGGVLSSQSVLHHLNALSGVYRRAIGYQIVPLGYNPVAAMLEKPLRSRAEAHWHEVHEASLLLEAARTLASLKRAHITFGYELIATLLLTGGRLSEVLGLEVEDVSFDRKTVTFRPNQWRGLKTEKSSRVVPLWPQLEEILRPYVFGSDHPPVRLLFPTMKGKGREALLANPRKLLQRVGERANMGPLRTKPLRHTYITARLQTMDRGQPVSLWTVAREVGHASTEMIERIYGHLGEVRHRSDVVEFRVEQHEDLLAESLALMGKRNTV